MTKLLQINNTVYEYPQQGTGQGHGEDATAWAEGVTESLANFLGPNDILLTSANLANNVSVSAVIPGLSFNTGAVQHINTEFLIVRIYDLGNTKVVESGKVYGNFNGSDFRVSIESVGDDTGINIDVNPSGQFIYTSSELADHQSSVIFFKAQTIDS
jgi:hypothetical protein